MVVIEYPFKVTQISFKTLGFSHSFAQNENLVRLGI